MNLIINGEARMVSGCSSISELLTQFNLQARMVVVEHNREIVSRDRYDTTALAEGDVLEIVQMMAGG